MFLGFLACGRTLNVTGPREQAIFAALLCFSSLLRGNSYAGDGGLFITYFSHSEMDNGLILLCLYFALRGRLATSFALNGVVFFINAFMAVWNIIPLALVAGYVVASGKLPLRKALLRGMAGIILAFVAAAPALRVIVSSPDFGKPTTFDYVRFLEQFWPFHFLIWSLPTSELSGLLCVVALAVAALRWAGKNARQWSFALAGYIAVYVIGVLLPYISHKATLINLHLLRSSAILHLLGALFSCAVTTKWLLSADQTRSRILGPLLALSLCVIRPLVWLAVVILSWKNITKALPSPQSLRLDYAAACALLIFIPYSTWHRLAQNRVINNDIAENRAVGEWARRNTPLDSVFLVPTSDMRQYWLSPVENGRPQADPSPGGDSVIFEYASHRRIWVDFKRGAAVMWMPSYYPEWHQRITEVLKLSSTDARIAFARTHHINYVVDLCAEANASAATVFRTQNYCVYPAYQSTK